MHDTQAARTKHIGALQSMRGVAAMVVLWSHCLDLYDPSPLMVELTKFVNAEAAVTLFFVLSGFVLTLSLKERMSVRQTTRFYIKRVLRIYPAIWIASTIALFYIVAIHYRFDVPNESAWFAGRFAEDRFDFLYIAASYAGIASFLLPPLWSVFVELIGSVLMPWIAHGARYDLRLFWAIFALLLLLSLTVGILMPYGLGMYLVYFCLGAAIYFLEPGRLPLRAMFLLGLTYLLFAGFFVGYIPLLCFIQACAATIMVLAVAQGYRPKLLESKSMLYLGDISFSVYLVHFPIMGTLAHILLPNPFLLAIATTALTIPVAALCYRYVELPGIALGRVIDRRVFSVAQGVRSPAA